MLIKNERIGWAIVFAVAALLYAVSWHVRYVGFYYDDADYIVEALSPKSAVLQRWPGFSLALAPLARIVQPHWEFLKVVPFALVLACVAVAARWWRRLFSAEVALVGAALLAWTPATVERSVSVLSEPLFFLFVLLSLAPLDAWPSRRSVARSWGLGLVAAAAALIRPEGALVPFALGVAFVLFEDLMMALRVILPSVISLGALLVYLHAHGAVYWHDWTANEMLLKPAYIFHQFSVIMLTLFPGMLFNLPVPHVKWAWVGCGILSGAGAIAAFWGIKRRLANTPQGIQPLAIAIFVVGYCAVHSLWPVINYRLVWVLLPWVMYGVATLAPREIPLVWREVLGIAAVVLLGSYLWTTVKVSRITTPFPRASLDWMRSHVSSTDEVLALNPSMVFLYSGCSAVALHGAGLNGPAAFRYDALSRGITLIYYTPSPGAGGNVPSTDRLLDRWSQTPMWMDTAQSAFHREYGPDADGVMIYRVSKDKAYPQAYLLFESAMEDWRAGHIDWAKAKLAEVLREEPDFPEAKLLVH